MKQVKISNTDQTLQYESDRYTLLEFLETQKFLCNTNVGKDIVVHAVVN